MKFELESEIAKILGVKEWRGYLNPFTRAQAPQAKFKNGARVTKAAHDPTGDVTADGTQGTVLGSIHAPGVGCGYFVEWDDKPHVALFVVEQKLK